MLLLNLPTLEFNDIIPGSRLTSTYKRYYIIFHVIKLLAFQPDVSQHDEKNIYIVQVELLAWKGLNYVL